ncbi:hypothetical protein Q6245_30450, partial [Klebsiella pneumoniae]|uniref:hypothetical protein n=1 Tax=Klebsiella pneumoniae TaxID=573 RepID=UPI00272FD12C
KYPNINCSRPVSLYGPGHFEQLGLRKSGGPLIESAKNNENNFRRIVATEFLIVITEFTTGQLILRS